MLRSRQRLKKPCGGRVEPYLWPGRIENVGIENLRCESTFDPANPKDENHSWFAITVENAQNAWVRQVTANSLRRLDGRHLRKLENK